MSFQTLKPPSKRGVRLREHTSLGVGGAVKLFFAPRSIGELREELQWAREECVPVRVLGGGTNTVCRDEVFCGAIISLQALNCACHEGRRIRARAGCSLPGLVRKSPGLGLSGLEVLAGIPGTIGGAVVMNAGGRHGTIGPLVEEVRTLTLGGEEKVYYSLTERFSYRKGDFGAEIVTEVVLKLEYSRPEIVRQRIRRILREKIGSQPCSARSAGCVFRNPPGDSAGRLIDACGLKGASSGGMLISPVHANFIVNTGEGTFAEFMALAELAKTEVHKRFGVALEFEVNIV